MSLVVLAPSGQGRPTYAAPFFADNLEGGQINPANGFTWNEVIGTVSDDYAVNGGTHSIKMTYSASALGTYAGGPTLRFRFGREVFDLWAEYWIRIPANYFHRENYTAGPPEVAMGNGNKFWMVWAYPPGAPGEGYSSGAWQAGCQTGAENSGGGGYHAIPHGELASGRTLSRSYCHRTSTSGAFPDLFSPSDTRPVLFGAGAPGPVGQWHRIRYHVKRCSAIDVADGKWEMWCNDSLIASFTDCVGPSKDQLGWFSSGLSRGYYMGASSSGYAEDTTFYLADFKFYDGDPGWAA